MRNFRTEGIIIRRRDFKDADRILTVLTSDHGKIAIRAAGIRRIPSRRSAHVELLNHCVLGLYQGNKFPILTEAQTIDSFSPIKEDLQKIGLAYHLCELVDGLCPEGQESRQVFHLVKNTLTRLAQSGDSFSLSDPDLIGRVEGQEEEGLRQAQARTIVHEFQMELLSMLGYWNKQEFLTDHLDMDVFVENILERKLKSKSIFAKLQ